MALLTEGEGALSLINLETNERSNASPTYDHTPPILVSIRLNLGYAVLAVETESPAKGRRFLDTRQSSIYSRPPKGENQ
jgi:hypothetical protein